MKKRSDYDEDEFDRDEEGFEEDEYEDNYEDDYEDDYRDRQDRRQADKGRSYTNQARRQGRRMPDWEEEDDEDDEENEDDDDEYDDDDDDGSGGDGIWRRVIFILIAIILIGANVAMLVYYYKTIHPGNSDSQSSTVATEEQQEGTQDSSETQDETQDEYQDESQEGYQDEYQDEYQDDYQDEGQEDATMSPLGEDTEQEPTPFPTATPKPLPTNTPTPVPTATPTPIPTATPIPTSTPTPQEIADILFIGDSRFRSMHDAVTQGTEKWECSATGEFSWLIGTAYSDVDGIIGQGTKVFINIGLNDLMNYQAYASSINNKAAEWKERGASVFFVSIGPVSSSSSISNDDICTFNTYMYQNLEIPFVDTYNYLVSMGFETTDGQTYTDATSSLIYTYLNNFTA